ncbi:metal ABC transporter ATP-binding protein [Allopusillimonas soli]|uniref:Metal ABC transporter ATP-binding protein n=1 Tax=Allopusillimonas soli TaxID=659016 RepID=A0A853F6H3_9BURK|nr:metal ABC transporter ATP-binding protein [Allopusillimonas soli]NYT35438.1 metal ABC transporter ATP-binding protein [Allopusillimonas soli]TEA75853.1 metal ABC transporter ATP-binding protein [Allopusillimonas soli]
MMPLPHGLRSLPTAQACGPAAALDIRGLTVSYGGTSALFSVDYSVPTGCMSAIVGPNGAGKSTLAKAALGLIPRLSGDIRVFGSPVGQVMHRVAYVPQRADIDWDFPATVFDVVAMGTHRRLGWLRWWRRTNRSVIQYCLERVGMDNFADRQIGALSGGQQQRVFVARALAQEADLYILDEPFAGVDAAAEHTLASVLRGLAAHGKSVVCIHHDLSTVGEYFQHGMLLNVRPIACGTIQQAFTPANLQEAYGGRLAASQIGRLRGEMGSQAPVPAPMGATP